MAVGYLIPDAFGTSEDRVIAAGVIEKLCSGGLGDTEPVRCLAARVNDEMKRLYSAEGAPERSSQTAGPERVLLNFLIHSAGLKRDHSGKVIGLHPAAFVGTQLRERTGVFEALLKDSETAKRAWAAVDKGGQTTTELAANHLRSCKPVDGVCTCKSCEQVASGGLPV
jgi:hypothetical protein